MPALVEKKGRKIRASRKDRIENIVGPMFARGAATVDIAKAAGISLQMCYQDLDLIREAYVEDFEGSMTAIRAELAAKHKAIYANAIEDYRKGAGLKALEVASKELECLARLHGVSGGVSVSRHSHDHQLNITSANVAELFKPLDAGSYAEMVSAKVLPPSEPEELPVIDAVAEPAGSDDWSGANASLAPVESHASQSEKPKGKNKRIQHPFRS